MADGTDGIRLSDDDHAHQCCIGSAIEIGLSTRSTDGYSEGVSVAIGGLPIFVTIPPRTAIKVAEAIIDRATVCLNQSAAPCGCDVKADWICAEHDPENILTQALAKASTIRDKINES